MWKWIIPSTFIYFFIFIEVLRQQNNWFIGQRAQWRWPLICLPTCALYRDAQWTENIKYHCPSNTCAVGPMYVMFFAIIYLIPPSGHCFPRRGRQKDFMKTGVSPEVENRFLMFLSLFIIIIICSLFPRNEIPIRDDANIIIILFARPADIRLWFVF